MKRRGIFFSSMVVVLCVVFGVQNQWLSLAAPVGDQLLDATYQSTPDFPIRPDPWLEEPGTGGNVYGAEIPSEAPLQPENVTVLGQPLETTSGLSFSCARFDDGKVYCWGDNQWGQLGNDSFINSTTPVVVGGLTDAVSIAALHKHVCALTAAGAVKCWGRNYHGELGNNSTVNSATPVDVVGLSSGVQQLAVGGFHACALLADGGIKCWGYNFHGQLGDGTFGETADRWKPVDVVDANGKRLTGFKAVFLGKYHSCALTAANTLKCWGYNMDGQVGDGKFGRDADKHSPVDVSDLTNVKAMAMGERHSCVLLTSGGIKCWGGGYEGQLGFMPENAQTSSPTDVPGLTSGVAKIAAGVYHSCAVLTNGALKCWGNNWAGQVGDNSTVDRSSSVDVVGAGSGVSQVSGGDSHTCAIINQHVSCWGSNLLGQVGNGQTGIFAPAHPVGLGSRVLAVASGAYHSCALLDEGEVKCWGRNNYGQLGDGTTQTRLVPVDVKGLGTGLAAVAIAVGGNHSCALLADNHIKCWGASPFGQLGNGLAQDSTKPVQVLVEPDGMEGTVHNITAGWEHTCAGVDTGFWCWGSNSTGELGNDNAPVASSLPVNVRRFQDEVGAGIFAGENNTCAFTTAGAAKCWGNNVYGQLGVGNTTTSEVPLPVSGLETGVTSITLGRYHACAVVNGGARCWGFNASGQVGDQTATNRWTPVNVTGLSGQVTSVQAGGLSSCALLTNGSVKCWGDNGFAQLGDGTTYSRSVPVTVKGVEQSKGIAMGMRHACSVSVSGAVSCWGANDYGQMGNDSLPYQPIPLQLPFWYIPQLSVNFASGQPDSYFTLTGIDYPPGVAVTVQVNTHTFTETVGVDSAGNFTFQLHVSASGEGYYLVTTQAAGYARSLMLQVKATDPLRPQIAADFLDVPEGIVYPYAIFLPLIVNAP